MTLNNKTRGAATATARAGAGAERRLVVINLGRRREDSNLKISHLSQFNSVSEIYCCLGEKDSP